MTFDYEHYLSTPPRAMPELADYLLALDNDDTALQAAITWSFYMYLGDSKDYYEAKEHAKEVIAHDSVVSRAMDFWGSEYMDRDAFVEDLFLEVLRLMLRNYIRLFSKPDKREGE